MIYYNNQNEGFLSAFRVIFVIIAANLRIHFRLNEAFAIIGRKMIHTLALSSSSCSNGNNRWCSDSAGSAETQVGKQ